MADSKLSQNARHVRTSPQNVGKLSFGSWWKCVLPCGGCVTLIWVATWRGCWKALTSGSDDWFTFSPWWNTFSWSSVYCLLALEIADGCNTDDGWLRSWTAALLEDGWCRRFWRYLWSFASVSKTYICESNSSSGVDSASASEIIFSFKLLMISSWVSKAAMVGSNCKSSLSCYVSTNRSINLWIPSRWPFNLSEFPNAIVEFRSNGTKM